MALEITHLLRAPVESGDRAAFSRDAQECATGVALTFERAAGP